MSRIHWGEAGQRIYEAGAERGVLYLRAGVAAPWYGLISVKENETEVAAEPVFVDGHPIRTAQTKGSFAATLESLMYPETLDGPTFDERGPIRYNLCYRTEVKNDQNSAFYKLHLVYNVLFSPPEKFHTTLATSPAPSNFVWNLTTKPVEFPGSRPSAHVVVDSRFAYPWLMTALEDYLYGSDTTDPSFPSPIQLLQIFEDQAILTITDHGDGTWSAEGPDDIVYMLDDDTFAIDWSSAVYIDDDTYTVHSL